MHKPKPYVCPTCGQEVPDLPVLKHQLSHVGRRPYARDRPRQEQEERPEGQKPVER